jgi:hypothetical protein
MKDLLQQFTIPSVDKYNRSVGSHLKKTLLTFSVMILNNKLQLPNQTQFNPIDETRSNDLKVALA